MANSNINRKDHFISQFLLKKFSIDSDRKSGLIFCYNSKTKNCREKSISKHIANGDEFYLGKNKLTKKPDKLVDEVYKEIEKPNHSPLVIKKVLEQNGSLSLSFKEESILATLIAHQYTRTKKYRMLINKFLTYLILNKFISKDELGDKSKINKVIVENEFNISSNDIEKCLVTNTSILRGIKSHEMFIAIQIAENIVQKIYKKNLHTIIAPKDHYFIISDHPVHVIGQEENLLNENKILNLRNFDQYSFIMPISPKKAIVFGDNYKQYGQITDPKWATALTIWINSLSVNNHDSEFYSHKKTFYEDYEKYLITPRILESYNNYV